MLINDINKQILSNNKIQHAILFFGDEDNCFNAAISLAKSLLCKNKNIKPCNNCSICNKIKKNIHPDVKIISSDKTKNSFHVEKIRELKSDAYTTPTESEYKIYILKNAQAMTLQAQNAILKLLEEPPKNVIFILTSENKQELLPTVISRCVCFDIGSCYNLEKEKIKDIATKLLGALISDYFEFFVKTSLLLNEKDKIVILEVSKYIINSLDNALIYKNKQIKQTGKDIYLKLAEKFSYTQIAKLEEAFIEFNQKLEMNANKNMLITNLSIKVDNIVNKGKM